MTVNDQLATYKNSGKRVFNKGNNIWASLIEKAYVQLWRAEKPNAWKTISGGSPLHALTDIMGSPVTLFSAKKGSWQRITFNSRYNKMDRGHKIQPADLQKELIDDLAHGDVIVLSSHTNLDTSKPQHHDLSIYGYDSKNDVLQSAIPTISYTRPAFRTFLKTATRYGSAAFAAQQLRSFKSTDT